MKTALFELIERELKKWYRVPALLIVSLSQPIIWIILFGNAFNPTKLFGNIPAAEVSSIMASEFMGASNYISFLTPGILSLTVLFASFMGGMSLLWDRRFGFLTKLLVSPIRRESVFISKIIANSIKGLIQATIILVVALLLPDGLKLSSGFGIVNLLLVYLFLFLLSFIFGAIFVTLTVRITKWETAMSIMNLLNLPIFFVSTALFPATSMPGWMKYVAIRNPLSYASNSIRILMLKGALTSSISNQILQNLMYMGIYAIIFLAIGIIVAYYTLTDTSYA